MSVGHATVLEETLGKENQILSPNQAVSLVLDFKRTGMFPDCQPTLKNYELIASIKNTGKKRIEDWYVEVELPTVLLPPHAMSLGARVPQRSDANRTLFRPLSQLPAMLCGDDYEFKIPYLVNENIFYNHREVFEEAAIARVFVDGERVDEVVRRIGDIQDY